MEASSGTMATIAGRPHPEPGLRNDPSEIDPLNLNLPLICLGYYRGRPFISERDGDLMVLGAQN
ncbi:MAG: hypothetical protein AB1445_13885 [Bacillota bacterium]